MSETLGDLIWKYIKAREEYNTTAGVIQAGFSPSTAGAVVDGAWRNVEDAEALLISEIRRLAVEP